MARALWKGSIAFGLVNIPVELHTAVRDHRPRFRLLHHEDSSPIEYQRVCRREGKPVAWDDIVKGYEYEKGRFIVLTKDDFETAALEKSRAIDISDFVDKAEIDERFFDVPYYVTPTKASEHAYAVMREGLRETGKVGIARVMLRQVQHLAALDVLGDTLVLTLMRFADDLVDVSTVHTPEKVSVNSKEVQLARTLMGSLTSKWNPSKYEDKYTENLLRVIKSKLKGKKVRLAEEEEPRKAKVIDLMTRLRQSLEQSKSRPPKRARTTARSRSAKARSSGTRKRSRRVA